MSNPILTHARKPVPFLGAEQDTAPAMIIWRTGVGPVQEPISLPVQTMQIETSVSRNRLVSRDARGRFC